VGDQATALQVIQHLGAACGPAVGHLSLLEYVGQLQVSCIGADEVTWAQDA
jgi:hypothetical protein